MWILGIIEIAFYSFLSYYVIRKTGWLMHLLTRKHPNQIDFMRRYGEDSWVAVTGATDGIGKGFC